MNTLRKIFIQTAYCHLFSYLTCNLSSATIFESTVDNFSRKSEYLNAIDNSPDAPIELNRKLSENMKWNKNNKLKYDYKVSLEALNIG